MGPEEEEALVGDNEAEVGVRLDLPTTRTSVKRGQSVSQNRVTQKQALF